MNDLLNRGFYFDTDQAAGSGGDKGDPPPEGDKQKKGDKSKEKEAPTFDVWHESLDDAAKGLIKGHVSGLKTSLETEREARKEAETVVRDLADKAEKGSEAQKELLVVADSLGEATRKADFYELAHDAGITNIKLAYIVAEKEDLISKRGNVDFTKMKESYPQLFGKVRTPGADAGDGKGDDLKPKADMNAFIRSR